MTVEALYHLTGGEKGMWVPAYVKHEGDTHWFLVLKSFYATVSAPAHWNRPWNILDPTVSQFKTKPDYSKGKRCGFLTKKPSKRAKALMEQMVWQ